MLRRWLCQADVTLRIKPIDPLLIKSGYATIDGPDMVPVSTFGMIGGESRGTDPTYFLPGTSLKGVLRSHLEKIARTLRPGSVCIPYYEQPGRPTVPVASEADRFGCGFRERNSRKHDTTAENYADSCAACRMFGSLKFGGRFSIGDAYPDPQHLPKAEDRDGVGIDRFTGGTVPGVLFNLRVLVGGEFVTQIRLVNFETWQLAALGLLLLDLKDEIISIGSGRSRGLGRVRGQVDSYQLTYLATTPMLTGLFDLATAEERAAYEFLPWSATPPIRLPDPAQIRGLRQIYDITHEWENQLTTLAPSFEQFLMIHGGPRGTPVAAGNH